ncbi:DUF5681 domain-containing protein [Mitsuaria sp. GD03876]|uniref:DUF5681 domain-containing protein n=1 Tax=Mitsuaria sp. GD03876 TaxID=2975399 RepID=UPI00244B6DDF|nr:DUF5681 domain-containing protein [Mitsuaria sp. GD03876]MDH0866614.1 DUF5681 domain-containing protein [Mitsuaria sp. GD03876]
MVQSVDTAEVSAEPRAKRGGWPDAQKWKPGESGNPGGRSRKTSDGRTVTQLARDMTEPALRTLAEIHANKRNAPGIRVQAAEAILRRGWADAPTKGDALLDGLQFVIQTIQVQAAPVPGVLSSPVAGHIGPPRAAPDGTGEVLDME